jgi:hypothetical protein
MALRNTQIAVEVLETEANPNLRNTQIAVEVLETEANPNLRNTQIAVEVLEVTNLMQVAQQFVQVISNNDPVNTIQVAQQFVQVISKNPIQEATFVGNDGDPPDSDVWSVQAGTPVIDTNQLEFLVNSGMTDEKVKNKQKVAGDFEIYIDIDVDQEPAQDNWSFGLDVEVSLDTYFKVNREYDNVNGQDVVVRTADGGAETVYRISDNPSTTKLKIKKEGNTFKGWYWDGSAFVQIGSDATVGLSPDEFWVYMVAETKNNEAQLRVLVDKFTILSGYFADSFLQNVYLTIIEG